MKTIRLPLLSFFLLLLAGLMLSACDLIKDDDDDHADAHGVRLVMNGVIMYQVFKGEVSCATAPCGFTIPEGDETPLIKATFLDEDGDPISESLLNKDNYQMNHALEADGVAEFEQHEEDGKWSFHLGGESVGVTRFQIKLMHGDHADFTTPPLSDMKAIQITVLG